MTDLSPCIQSNPWTPERGRSKSEISHPDFEVFNAATRMPGNFQFDDHFVARCKHCGFQWNVVGVGGASW